MLVFTIRYYERKKKLSIYYERRYWTEVRQRDIDGGHFDTPFHRFDKVCPGPGPGPGQGLGPGIAIAGQVFLWLPRWGLASLQVTRYSYSWPGIPMAAQVGMPSLQVTRYSYSCPGIPMAAQVGMPSLQVTRYSYSWPGIPMAAQVGMPSLQVTRCSYSWPGSSYCCLGGDAQPPSYQVFL